MVSGKPSLTLSKKKHLKIVLHTSDSHQIYNSWFCSIGSLGQGHSTGTVSAVVLDTAFLKNTTNGLRIKTWQVKSQFLILALFCLLSFQRASGFIER